MMLYVLAMMFVCVGGGEKQRGARKFILLMKHEDVELIQSTRYGRLQKFENFKVEIKESSGCG